MSETVIIDDFRLSAGGVLIDEDRKMVCLIKSISSKEYLLPKGGKNPFESIPEAAQREVFEETGYENEIAPEKLLGIHFRPQIAGMPEKHKVIYWYYSKLTNRVFHEGTQEEGEDFCSEWLSLEEAVEKLSFAEDKILVNRGFQSMSGTGIESKVEEYSRVPKCDGSYVNNIRYLTFRVVKRFAALDTDNKRILLTLYCVTNSWCLPTEKCVELSEILCRKLEKESAPFLFELIIDAEGVSVREWYHLDIPDGDFEDTQVFNKDEALDQLKNNLHEMSIVKSAFRKYGCDDNDNN